MKTGSIKVVFGDRWWAAVGDRMGSYCLAGIVLTILPNDVLGLHTKLEPVDSNPNMFSKSGKFHNILSFAINRWSKNAQ